LWAGRYLSAHDAFDQTISDDAMIATPLKLEEPTFDDELREEDESAPVVFLVAYGRGTHALTSGLERARITARSFDRILNARTEVARTQPDLILVGGDHGDGSSLDFIRELRQEGVESLVFYLAHSTDPRLIGAGLDAGADDVCVPPHSVGSILVRRLVNVRRRESPTNRPRTRQNRPLTLAGVTVDPFTREVSDGRVPFTLSGRELELLVHLMEAAGDVVTRAKLLQEIWGDEQQDDAVLDATVHRLRKRLEERLSRPGFVATVRGVGYRLKKE
jgi:DNA-binding response OmpR family regulator